MPTFLEFEKPIAELEGKIEELRRMSEPDGINIAEEVVRLTAEDLKRMALVDAVIPEPLGGAQRDPQATIQAVGEAVADALGPLVALDGATLKARRRDKYLEMGREALG